MRKTQALLLIVGLLVSLFVTACGKVGNGATSLAGVPTPTPLPTPVVPEKPQYRVEQGTVVNALEFNGRISPVNEAQLAFEASGSVSGVNVSEGDDVPEGAVLAELNVTADRPGLWHLALHGAIILSLGTWIGFGWPLWWAMLCSMRVWVLSQMSMPSSELWWVRMRRRVLWLAV